MSSRNKAVKDSNHDPKRSSGHSSIVLKHPRQPSTSAPSSRKRQKQLSSSSSKHRAEQAPTSRPSYVSHTSTSTSNTSQSNTTETYDASAYAYTDLISVSAWIQTHPDESVHHYQDFSPPLRSNTQTTTCPCHAPIANTMNSQSYGLAPFERWIHEDLGDGGALALQFGRQMRLDCTCVVVPGDFNEKTVEDEARQT